jgi:hypothetical protein
MLFNFAFMTPQESNASLESFIRNVLPAFSDSRRGGLRASV